MKKLNIGCGTDIKKNYINLDSKKLKDVDVVHNLNNFPWPFKNNEFDLIEANHILEHLEDIPKCLREIWRISKKGGKVSIRGPHYASPGAWYDLTHKHPFGWMSLDYMASNRISKFSVGGIHSHEYGNKEKFEVFRKLNFGKLHKFMGVNFFANKFPIFYEMYLAYIFPPREIIFKLKTVK
jgi:ubiquinone/menaquinone biosynthesis C-methylase UbiE